VTFEPTCRTYPGATALSEESWNRRKEDTIPSSILPLKGRRQSKPAVEPCSKPSLSRGGLGGDGVALALAPIHIGSGKALAPPLRHSHHSSSCLSIGLPQGFPSPPEAGDGSGSPGFHSPSRLWIVGISESITASGLPSP
jgi:hypothetical protein